MKHIAIDARELRTSTGRYIERLLHHLQQIDNAHRYTILLKPEDMDSWQPANPNFSKLACSYKEFTLGEQTGMLHLLNDLKPDLMHFGITQQPVMYRGNVITSMLDLTTVRFKNPAKNPVVFTLKQQIYAWVTKRVARKSAHIITISEYTKRDIAAFCDVSPDKITVTYLAADPLPGPATPIGGIDDKTEFIMYVGRPTPHKNLERLIKAFPEIKKGRPNLRLVLAGKKDDNYRRIENQVHEQGISDIVFTGFISDQQLHWLYEHCQAYIFPSLSEGFGLPGVEAMLHNAPVVSSNATCLPEIYGDAAHYFDPNDTTDMAEKIGEVLADQSLRRKLVAAGKKQASSYSWQRTAEQTLQIYTQTLERLVRKKS